MRKLFSDKESKWVTKKNVNNLTLEIIHTSDIIGDFESANGRMNTYVNGGRLQPECYSDEKDISNRIPIYKELYRNSGIIILYSVFHEICWIIDSRALITESQSGRQARPILPTFVA